MKFFTIFLFLLLPTLLFAQTVIYRSVKPDGSALATGAGNNLRVSNDTCYFASALPNGVGVGMALQYDDDNDGDIDANDSILFFKKRVSSTVFLGQTATGGTPTATAAVDQDWGIFPTYQNTGVATSSALGNWENGTENSNIDADLRAFDAGNRNIDSNSEQWNVACYAGIDCSNVSVSADWVTSATEYINIYTPTLSTEVGTSQRHTGKRTSGCYVLVRHSNAAAGSVFITTSANPGHVRFSGLVMKSSGSFAQHGIYIQDMPATGDARMDACVVIGSDSVTTQNAGGIYMFGGQIGAKWRISNSIFYSFETIGSTTIEQAIFSGGSTSTTAYIYNNTFVDCDAGITRAAGTFIAKNNITQTDDGFNGTFDAASNYNISNNAADAPGANSQNSTTVTFVDAANRNYLIAYGSNGSEDGTDLSGDSNLAVTTDILGVARPQDDPNTGGNAYDIGANEAIATTAAGNPRRNVIIIGWRSKLLEWLGEIFEIKSAEAAWRK